MSSITQIFPGLEHTTAVSRASVSSSSEPHQSSQLFTKQSSGRPILPTRKNINSLSKSSAKNNAEKIIPRQSTSATSKCATSQQCEAKYTSFDEILDESNAFLQCAYEAQALGRLNEAHSYLILAHGRLVGLGNFIEQEHDRKNGGDKLDYITSHEHEIHHLQEQIPDAANSMFTPHGAPSSLKPKITPSPTNTSSLNIYESNNLSGNLAQSAQQLLFEQKGIGNRYAADKERKAHNSRQRKARAASFDSKEVSDSSMKENLINSTLVKKLKPCENDTANLTTWSPSIMTAEFACLDAKALLGNKNASLR